MNLLAQSPRSIVCFANSIYANRINSRGLSIELENDIKNVIDLNSQNEEDIKDELDPGWTDYRKLTQYVTFDVTEQLHSGENVLEVEVGNGWFHKMDEHYSFRQGRG